jgi:hypothetical protein
MKYQIINVQEETIQFNGIACDLREHIENLFELKFGFCPMLQESEDDGYLEIYLHTDTYEELSDEEFSKLNALKITESDSLETICRLLNIRIKPLEEAQIV